MYVQIQWLNHSIVTHSYLCCSIKLPENGVSPEWYNYFLCGVKGICDELINGPRCGMLITVSGNIPPAAGLSSSSALVSAATLATSYVNEVCFELIYNFILYFITIHKNFIHLKLKFLNSSV